MKQNLSFTRYIAVMRVDRVSGNLQGGNVVRRIDSRRRVKHLFYWPFMIMRPTLRSTWQVDRSIVDVLFDVDNINLASISTTPRAKSASIASFANVGLLYETGSWL